jgi:6-phospho-beta-glucosidase
VKLAIIGGGGFRVPLVYGALLRQRPFDEVVLHDVDAERLDRIALVLEGQAAEHRERLPFRTTTDLDDALEGAGFVFAAIRVGGLKGRTVDEGVPLGHGVLGQETTGPGGICFALRTIPAMVDLAERVARRAPDAWLVNFTNPAGMVTEALQQVVGDRAIGVCDSPSALCRRVAATLGRPPAALAFDYFGLNHLGWLKGVRDGATDRLPELLADDEALDGLEEGRLFGAEWLRSIGMVPNEYLYYFYFAADTIEAIGRSPRPRGAYLLDQQAGFYDARPDSPAEALRAWRAAKDERDRTYMAEARNGHEGEAAASPDEPGGYEAEALAVVEAIRSGTGAVRILNTANRSALDFLDDHAVVEVPCVVDAAGARPVAVGPVPDHSAALMASVKAVERVTIEAALTGSTALAVKALALHPLVPSVTAARAIFAEYRQQLPTLEERFA